MDELTAFEARLRRTAGSRAAASGGDLGAVLDHVARRRAARRRHALVGDGITHGSTNPATDGPGAPTGEAVATDRPGTILAVDDLTPEVRILRVGRPPGFDFRAGQHVKLGPAGGPRATFSIASAPRDPYLDFCVELVPDGQVTRRLFALRPGDAVSLADRAKGSFLLDPAATHHVMVATVTGVAPFRSMLREVLAGPTDATFLLLHGASFGDELPFRAELTDLAAADHRFEYRPTVSRPGEARNRGWEGSTGRVDDLAVPLVATGDLARARTYACGNPGMVARVASALASTGVRVATEPY